MTSVSVIIPTYNAAAYLDQTLGSVAGQSRQPEEVVVADDCSTDETIGVAERWAGRLPLRVVRAPVNGGPAVARGLAIDASRGSLLALLDGDDVWLPDHLETLLAVHQRAGGIAMADAIRWAPGEALGSVWSDRSPVPPPEQQLHALYRRNWVITALLFERRRYVDVGGFRGSLRAGEDWDLWIRMVRAGAVVTQASHPTMLYRMTSGSLTSTTDRGVVDRLAVLARAATESGDDPSERAALRAGLRDLRAEQHLMQAYGHAAAGRPWRARAQGLAAVAGARRVAVRGLAMAAAPRAVGERRRRRRGGPRGRLLD